MSEKIKCIIIDDEPKAIELLSASILELYPDMEITNTFTTWTTAINALRNVDFDILFTDISMPGKNGMDILRLVPEIKFEIIFITAHAEYALDAFKFPVAGYVLKPVEDEELISAIDKAIDRVRTKKMARDNRFSAEQKRPSLEIKIGIPNNKGIDYVNIRDIIYFETFNKCTRVVTNDQELISSYNIGKFKEMLDDQSFYQVHRSFIVNLNFVRRYESAGYAIMSNDKEVPVSKNEKEDFLKFFTTVTKNQE